MQNLSLNRPLRVDVRVATATSFSSRVVASVKALLLACGLVLAIGATSTATASAITITTDSSWLATNAAPGSGWNTNFAFNTTGWIGATEINTIACIASTGAGCIWYDGQFSATQSVWLRQTFTISEPVTTAFLKGGVDDDASIWVNGTLVYSDNNGSAQNYGPIDIAAYLTQGINLVAVAVSDNPFFGQNHAFAARLDIVTQTAVPEPSSLLLLGLGLAAAGVSSRHRRRVVRR